MTYTQVWDAMRNQVSDSMIKRDEDGAFVPFDPDNVDYAEYLRFLEEGGAPTPYTPPNEATPYTPPPAPEAQRG
jgi:hypothetical protein